MTAPLDDALIGRARALVVDGKPPTITAVQRELRVRQPTAREVHRAAFGEIGEPLPVTGDMPEDPFPALSDGKDAREDFPVLPQDPPRKGEVREGSSRPLPEILPTFPSPSQDRPHREGAREGRKQRREGTSQDRPRRVHRWPLLLLALPAFVAIWAGWVDLGRLTGFGVVRLLPGIADRVQLNTAITLPIGLETYAAYALYIWLTADVPAVARTFAKWSAIGSLVLGFAGQAVYHLLIAFGVELAPWPITLMVSGVPVAVMGMGAALIHLITRKDGR